ncbi:MAG: hypothetical protein ACK559_41705, partial [bacterium]
RLSSFKKRKLSEQNINNSKNHGNRGLELILSGGKRKQPKYFHIIFEKLVCFLKREVTIYFEFSLDIKKSGSSRGRKKC